MSRRLPPEEPPAPPELVDPELLEPLEPPESVEYFVDVLDCSWVRTFVPNSAHSSQTCNSAPSTLTVLGALVSAPHISH
ncbi:hypothetical protein HTIA_0539 [Halorhabdus tiamatea SARL4B]|uniref:Uncharacterized protein n=1 Tax=Halorhabdus tiamatea SARL4B TaxID=1033806 RepID=S6CSG3_9EURY|nr:hypothetical protein HTIA_0539 [Halorhabdus tiamatea SARL4B]